MSENAQYPGYTEQLRVLRERRGEALERTNKLRMEHQKLHKALLAAIETEPLTVPELSVSLGRTTQEVFWHLMALKKYNQVVEDRKRGEYVGYRKKN